MGDITSNNVTISKPSPSGMYRGMMQEIKESKNKQTMTCKESILSNEDSVTASDLLSKQDILILIKRTLDETIVEEGIVKVLLYLLCLTRHFYESGEPQTVLLLSESSAGKSYLIEEVLKLFCNESYKIYTRQSKTFIETRNEDWNGKIVYFGELNASEESFPILRQYISERRVRSGITEQVKGTFLGLERNKEDVPVIIASAAKEITDAELQNRVWTLSLDESNQQTDKIIKHTLETKGSAKPKIIFRSENWHNIQNVDRLLEEKSCLVELPYNKFIQYPTKNLRDRRDVSKFIALIKVISFLHQHNRLIKEGIIFANTFDFKLAQYLWSKTSSNTASGLSTTKIVLLEVLPDNSTSALTPSQINELLPSLKKGTISKYLNELSANFIVSRYRESSKEEFQYWKNTECSDPMDLDGNQVKLAQFDIETMLNTYKLSTDERNKYAESDNINFEQYISKLFPIINNTNTHESAHPVSSPVQNLNCSELRNTPDLTGFEQNSSKISSNPSIQSNNNTKWNELLRSKAGELQGSNDFFHEGELAKYAFDGNITDNYLNAWLKENTLDQKQDLRILKNHRRLL